MKSKKWLLSIGLLACVTLVAWMLPAQTKTAKTSSCASMICGKSIAQRKASAQVGPKATVEAFAACNPDEVVISGGFRIDDYPPLLVTSSEPKLKENGWKVTVTNHSVVAKNFKAFALCMKKK